MIDNRKSQQEIDQIYLLGKLYGFLYKLSQPHLTDEEIIERTYRVEDFKLISQIKQIRQFLIDNPMENLSE